MTFLIPKIIPFIRSTNMYRFDNCLRYIQHRKFKPSIVTKTAFASIPKELGVSWIEKWVVYLTSLVAGWLVYRTEVHL